MSDSTIPAHAHPDLWAYHLAPSGEGPYAPAWKDKPHRIVYDLTHIAAEARAENAALRELLAEAISDVARNDLGADQDSLYHRMKAALGTEGHSQGTRYCTCSPSSCQGKKLPGQKCRALATEPHMEGSGR